MCSRSWSTMSLHPLLVLGRARTFLVLSRVMNHTPAGQNYNADRHPRTRHVPISSHPPLAFFLPISPATTISAVLPAPATASTYTHRASTRLYPSHSGNGPQPLRKRSIFQSRRKLLASHPHCRK